jgi:hypothetical protein
MTENVTPIHAGADDEGADMTDPNIVARRGRLRPSLLPNNEVERRLVETPMNPRSVAA